MVLVRLQKPYPNTIGTSCRMLFDFKVVLDLGLPTKILIVVLVFQSCASVCVVGKNIPLASQKNFASFISESRVYLVHTFSSFPPSVPSPPAHGAQVGHNVSSGRYLHFKFVSPC